MFDLFTSLFKDGIALRVTVGNQTDAGMVRVRMRPCAAVDTWVPIDLDGIKCQLANRRGSRHAMAIHVRNPDSCSLISTRVQVKSLREARARFLVVANALPQSDIRANMASDSRKKNRIGQTCMHWLRDLNSATENPLNEIQIIEMLSSSTQQCRIERGRVQVRRHRPSTTNEIQGERFWSEWITVAAAPLTGRQGQNVKQRAN